MREIKFRGQRLDNKQWVTGGYFGCQEEDRFVHYIFTQPNGAESIDSKTVGQFTGLTDKNGKEIYEGDIINLHIFVEEMGANYGVSEGEREYIGFICFEELGLAFKRTADDEDWFYLVYTPGMLHEESFDVLGNIFENPELLKP